MKELKCPKCNSPSFSYWNKAKKREYALCTRCFNKAPVDQFFWEDNGFWDSVDNYVKEMKIQRYLKQ